jgi:hypothetical protein
MLADVAKSAPRPTAATTAREHLQPPDQQPSDFDEHKLNRINYDVSRGQASEKPNS